MGLLRGKLQAMFTGKPRALSTERRPTDREFKREGWAVGDVYVWLQNDLAERATVYPQLGGKDPFSKQEQRVVLRPGEGKQVVAIDGQAWVVEVAGGEHPCGGAASTTFAVTMGKVQDLLLSTAMGAQARAGTCPATAAAAPKRKKKAKAKRNA